MAGGEYDAAYKYLPNEVTQAERKATFGEDDIGQHSWLTRIELETFISWLGLAAQSHVLDIGSGGGGPAVFIAQQAGCAVTGIDISPVGVKAANQMAGEKELSAKISFLQHDAVETLPFDDNELDATVGFDSFFHMPNRKSLLAEIKRILRPNGKLLFTDGGVVTGAVSSDEFALRSMNGFAQYTAPGMNEELLADSGFRVLLVEDVTWNNEYVAHKRYQARAELADAFIELEGKAAFHKRQVYLQLVAKLAREKRLSRFAYLASKVSGDA